MTHASERFGLNIYERGDLEWNHEDLVLFVDEHAIDRGEASEGFPTPEYDGELFFAEDRNLLYRWNADAASWNAIAGKGTESHPMPGITFVDDLDVGGALGVVDSLQLDGTLAAGTETDGEVATFGTDQHALKYVRVRNSPDGGIIGYDDVLPTGGSGLFFQASTGASAKDIVFLATADSDPGGGTPILFMDGSTLDVEVPNGNLVLNDADISGVGRIFTGRASPSLLTNGSGSGEWRFRDAANGQDIARFNEGGEVEIPNGVLTFNLGDIEALNGDLAIRPNSGVNGRFDTGGGGADQVLIWDAANAQTLLEAHEGGNVDVPSGDFTVGGETSTATAHFPPEPEPATPASGCVRWYDSTANALKVKFDDGSVATIAEK